MRFFKYLIFLVLSFFSVSVFADLQLVYYINDGKNQGSTHKTPEAACKSSLDTNDIFLSVTQITNDGGYCNFSRNGINNTYIILTKYAESKCEAGKTVYLDGYITSSTGFPPDSLCSGGCQYTKESDGLAFDTPNGNLNWGFDAKQTGQSCTVETPKGEDRPNSDFQCKNASGSDAYCDKPTDKNCPANYSQQSFNNRTICVKNSTSNPNPNDPNNNGGGNGDTDLSGVIAAINAMKDAVVSAVVNVASKLSEVKNSVDANTAAVNANGDKVANAVNNNTNAVNANGDKVANAVNNNTNAVNANGDKVTNAVNNNTNAVNENGKNTVDAINKNGKNTVDAIDKNTEEVKKGNGFLEEIKDWLFNDELPNSTDNKAVTDSDLLEDNESTFRFAAQCPAPVTEQISIIGYSWTFSFSFESYCTVLTRLAPYFVFSAYLAAAFIIAGVRDA